MAEKREKSPVNEKMLDAAGTNVVTGTAPGMDNRIDVSFEELGKLADFPDPIDGEKPNDGTGEYVVILADYLSGAGENNFFKGDVRRLSQVIPGYEDEDRDLEVIKGRIKRLMDTRSIRMALSNERGKIDVSVDDSSQAMIDQRNKNVALEQENEILRAKLEQALGSSTAATPGEAGKDATAKTAVTQGDEFD